MAYQPIQHTKIHPKGISTYEKDKGFEPSPFEIIITKSEVDGGISVKVTKYSSLIPDWNIIDTIPIVGLDWNFGLSYGTKIYLEVFYDKNLNPICPNIRYAKKWTSTTINPIGETPTLTYPNLLEFITKKDLDAKQDELADQQSINNSILADILADIETKKIAGSISTQYADWYSAKVNADYAKTNKDLKTMADNFSQFFTAGGLQKKQFKSFTLIGYTTKDTGGELLGKAVRTVQIVEPTPVAGINQATSQPTFKIIQCLKNDLILIESCYKNLVPCKIPYPYSRPVYYFDISGESEEKTNTK